jgi:hypothetical protein
MLLEGMKPTEIADELDANRSFVYRTCKEMQESGELAKPVTRSRRSRGGQPVSPSRFLGNGSGDNTGASPAKKPGDKQETQGTNGRERAAGPDR